MTDGLDFNRLENPASFTPHELLYVDKASGATAEEPVLPVGIREELGPLGGITERMVAHIESIKNDRLRSSLEHVAVFAIDKTTLVSSYLSDIGQLAHETDRQL